MFTDSEITASVELPPKTRYLLVEIQVSEDVLNDAEAPEFAGHFADDLSLVLQPPRQPEL